MLYYARERYYRHVQTSVLEVLKKYGSDPVLLFWKAYGIIMEGMYDGIQRKGHYIHMYDLLVMGSMQTWEESEF